MDVFGWSVVVGKLLWAMKKSCCEMLVMRKLKVVWLNQMWTKSCELCKKIYNSPICFRLYLLSLFNLVLHISIDARATHTCFENHIVKKIYYNFFRFFTAPSLYIPPILNGWSPVHRWSSKLIVTPGWVHQDGGLVQNRRRATREAVCCPSVHRRGCARLPLTQAALRATSACGSERPW
jgi:hypothetical protein